MKNTSIRKSWFKKGQPSWNKGKKMPESMKEKMRIIASRRTGENSPRWQKEPTYNALHLWLKIHHGSAKQCEKCGKLRKDGMVHWANKSQKYLRDITDWMQLCPKCHEDYDKRWLKRYRNKKGQFK